MELKQALALVRASGFKVSKAREPKLKNWLGPTCVATFADGTVTRMGTYCRDDNLDYQRGERLARAAWLSRHGNTFAPLENTPAVASIHFERDGRSIEQRRAA